MGTLWRPEALFKCVGVCVNKLAFAVSRVSEMDYLGQQKQSPILIE